MKTHRFLIIMGAALILGTSAAVAVGMLSLPTDPVAVTHGPWNQGSNSTIDITLAMVPPGYSVDNGTYAGWCIEDNHQPDVPDGSLVMLLDSTDTDPLVCDPGGFPGVPWDQINYLLNHQQGAMGDVPATIEDIQAAMWIVAGTDDPGWPTFPTTAEVNALVADTQLYGPGFMPMGGDVTAVILCADGLGPDPYQDTIIEVSLGYGCTPGFWKQKQHFGDWTNPPADPYSTTFAQVFTVIPTNGDMLLAKALKQGGGGENALLRHGSAAYLNAISPDVDYFFTADEVVTMVQDAYASGDFEAAKDLLEAENERGCPL
jgi:hypothetical protein